MTRHDTGVKAILCLPLCAALCFAADEAAGRAAIERTIASLNVTGAAPHGALFTEDATSELDRLPNVEPVAIRPAAPPEPIPYVGASGPKVTISHDEIWGEATIDWGFPSLEFLRLEFLNPRITCGAIRFITPDVALADGTWKHEDGPATQTIPLLFVMKNEAGAWKIASLRLLAPRPAETTPPSGK
jgi:hypothetical protein